MNQNNQFKVGDKVRYTYPDSALVPMGTVGVVHDSEQGVRVVWDESEDDNVPVATTFFKEIHLELVNKISPADYIKKVKSVDTNYPAVNERLKDNANLQALVHGSLGMSGETGEVVDLIKKHLIFNKPLDQDKLKKELGDVLWYMSVIIDAIGSSYEEIMQMNSDKLDARYPNGFSEQAALERKDLKK